MFEEAALVSSGDFKAARGQQQAALQDYLRARDFASASSQPDVHCRILLSSLELEQFGHIDVYADKLSRHPSYATDEYVLCAAGHILAFTLIRLQECPGKSLHRSWHRCNGTP